MAMNRESGKGVHFLDRMTGWLEDIVEADEPPSNEDEPQHPMNETKDWVPELEKYRAGHYHYRQPILMYTIACELEFVGEFTYPPDHLAYTRAVVLLWRSAKFDLETIDWLKHERPNEPARYQKACIGFEKLYGFPAEKFLPRMAYLPEEVQDCLMRRVILKYYSAWPGSPEEQRLLLETCEWIINTYLEFPVEKVKAAFTELCRMMGGKAKKD